VATSSTIPGDDTKLISTRLLDKNGAKTPWLDILLTDEKVFDLMNVRMAAGRSFDFSSTTDSMSIVINEAAAKMIGFDDAARAVNQYAAWPEGMWHHGGKRTRIIGVVKDYYEQSLKEQPKPTVFMPRKFYNEVWTAQYFMVRYKPGGEGLALDHLRAQWTKLFPADPFNYFFLEDHYNRQYDKEQKFASAFTVFTILAVIIATMGLYGLSAYTITRRTREVAIRKVLAASNRKIFMLLASDYFKLVLVAYLVAMPVGYHMLKSWLDGYQHRIAIGWWFFFFPGIIIMLVAMLSIANRIFKASRQSPVKALRSS
jgi:putative ABC transport system permease protein